MADIIWKVDALYEQALNHAQACKREISVDDFWFVADRDLAGPAPKTKEDLLKRWRQYVVLDVALEKYGFSGDPDIDASIKRNAILRKQCKQNVEDFGQDFANDDENLRFACRTNLLFLGREVFNKAFTFSTHARVCNFFVQKDPSISVERYHEQDTIHERLLLYPRGSFKSTIDVVDCVQWVILYPDIRILILAAESGLATKFVGEFKNYFTIVEGAENSLFQKLFADWTFSKRSDGPADRYTCPCRKHGADEKAEPTIWSASILTNLPGWHCDIMKADDTVNDKNSETPMLLAKVIRKIDYAESLIDPGGFKDLLGTPYAPSDLYNHTVTTALPEELKVLSKPARWLKPESMHKDEKDAIDSDFELLFEFDKVGTPRLTNKFLNTKRRRSPAVYNSQYLLNPAGVKNVKFPLELLMQRTIPWEQIPGRLAYYILWDFAYAAKSDNDYTVGAVVGLDEENRVFVVEVIRGRMKDSEIAMEVAKSYKQYHPKMVLIENSNGAQFLETTIRRYAEEMGVQFIPLDFFKCERTPNAKASRIGALQPLLVGGRLFFLNTIACLTGDEENKGLYDEFKDFGSSSHDDIPDAISHVHRVLPTTISEDAYGGRGPAGKEEAERLAKILQEKEFYDLIYQEGSYTPIAPAEPIPTEEQWDNPPEDPWSIPGLK